MQDFYNVLDYLYVDVRSVGNWPENYTPRELIPTRLKLDRERYLAFAFLYSILTTDFEQPKPGDLTRRDAEHIIRGEYTKPETEGSYIYDRILDAFYFRFDDGQAKSLVGSCRARGGRNPVDIHRRER